MGCAQKVEVFPPDEQLPERAVDVVDASPELEPEPEAPGDAPAPMSEPEAGILDAAPAPGDSPQPAGEDVVVNGHSLESPVRRYSSAYAGRADRLSAERRGVPAGRAGVGGDSRP